MKRTHLPLNGLRVLDAAARHLSFTRAADELAVTPAAVGQQIRALEDLPGVVLFRRTPRGLELTGEAEAGLPALREGFLHFEESVRAMQAGQSSHVYTIAAPREFIAAWLAPRLASFREAHPQVRFALHGGDNQLDFTEANLDLAVRFADGPGELEGVALGPAEQVTVAAPGASADAPWIGWPGDTQPADAEHEQPISVGDAGLALASAAAGLGRARVPAMLAQESLASGQVEIVAGPEPCRRTYWLVAPLPQWRQKKVRVLVEALAGRSS